LIKNGQLTAFALIGVTMLVSYWASEKLTRGRLHGSAIAILLCLLMAVLAGGKSGLSDIPMLSGVGLMGGACLASAGRPVEGEDSAVLLRLDAAQVPDSLQISSGFQGAQGGQDVRLHLRMQNEVLKAVTGLGLHDQAELRRGFLSLASAAARVKVIIGSGCIRGQFDLRGVACGHGLGGLWVQPNITRAAIRPATASHANKGS
jgi:hypothetical protein